MEMACTSVVRDGMYLALWLHTSRDPPLAEWRVGMELMHDLKKRAADWPAVRSLVISDGGAPNATQRGEIFHDLFEGRPHKLALVSNSLSNPIKKGIVTAIGWLNPAFRAFSPVKFQGALAHLEITDGSWIWPELTRLQAGLPPIHTLAAVLSQAGVNAR